MQQALRGLVLILVLKGVCPEAFTEDCKQEKLIQCSDSIKMFTENKDLGFSTEKHDLERLCPQLKGGLRCIEDYIKRCMSQQKREYFHKLYAGTYSVITQLCENATYQEEFLRHQPCLAGVRKFYDSCANDFQERISSVGPTGDAALSSMGAAAVGGSPAGAAPHEKKIMTREESEKFMTTVCCSFQGYIQCSKEIVLDACGSETAKFTERYLDQMAFPLIESHCRAHYVGSEKCADLLGSSASSPSASPLLLLLFVLLPALLSSVRPVAPST